MIEWICNHFDENNEETSVSQRRTDTILKSHQRNSLYFLIIQMSEKETNPTPENASAPEKKKKTVIPQGVGVSGRVWRKKHEQK